MAGPVGLSDFTVVTFLLMRASEAPPSREAPSGTGRVERRGVEACEAALALLGTRCTPLSCAAHVWASPLRFGASLWSFNSESICLGKLRQGRYLVEGTGPGLGGTHSLAHLLTHSLELCPNRAQFEVSCMGGTIVGAADPVSQAGCWCGVRAPGEVTGRPGWQ